MLNKNISNSKWDMPEDITHLWTNQLVCNFISINVFYNVEKWLWLHMFTYICMYLLNTYLSVGEAQST